PPHSLPPVIEQIGVGPDRDPDPCRDPIHHRGRPIQVAETVAGHIDGHASSATASAHPRVSPLPPSDAWIRSRPRIPGRGPAQSSDKDVSTARPADFPALPTRSLRTGWGSVGPWRP